MDNRHERSLWFAMKSYLGVYLVRLGVWLIGLGEEEPE